MAEYTQAQIDEVVRAYNAGEVTAAELAAANPESGLSAAQVQANLDAINAQQPVPNSPTPNLANNPTGPTQYSQADVDEVVRQYNAGEVTTQQLADRFPEAGLTPDQILANIEQINSDNGYTPPTGNTGPTITVPNRRGTGVNNPSGVNTAAAQLQANIANGNVAVPGADLQAVPTDLTGTITDSAEQITPITPVASAAPVAAPQIVSAPTVPTTTAQQAQTVQTQTIDNVEQIAQQASTLPAQATLSTGAVAADASATPVPGAQVSGVEVVVEPGSTVTAVTGTMPPEAIAEAAKVAGVDVSRITRAKTELRKAGLTEAQLAVFGNDPTALEAELHNFTEEQRGVIAGLPEEALVSTQMESLLEGIENGDTPAWAKPAVTSVEQMLARRGLSASTIGRDALANAIIQASIPIASANAQAIKESALRQKDIEAQAHLAEAQFKQQATLQNAQNSFNLNIRNLDAEQQAELANSQFMQTVSLTNTNNKQQAAIQNAVNMTQLQVEAIDSNSQIAINNAKNFLQMDLANLSNAQQALVIDQQFEQQRMLSNAAASNAAKQFNASSENQTNQFMANLSASIDQFNTQQSNAMKQFNLTESNKIAAINAGNSIQAQEFNAQLSTQVDQFNAQQELAVEQWNAANAQAVEQSNIQWRRQANSAETATQNAINQQNVQNAFSLTAQAQASLWQELRDAAMFTFQAFENKEDREAQLYATAIGNESAAGNSYDHTTHLVSLAQSFFA